MHYIEETLKFIKEYFKTDTSGHDFYHSLRVYQLSSIIAKNEICDKLLVQLSALLHDVDDRKINPTTFDLSTTKQFLHSIKLENHKIQDICNIISEISYKGTDSITPVSIESKIVQDADRLDAIGAIGIARAFTYGGYIHRSIYIPDLLPNPNMTEKEYYNTIGSTINHFDEKLMKLKDLMNTTTGKSIATKRHQFMEQFLTEFHNEWNCKI